MVRKRGNSSSRETNPFRLSPGVLAFQALTASRFFLAIVFAVILLSADWSTRILWTCFIILVIAELTDLLDGMLARRFGITSEFGAMLDPYIDSMTRLLVFWSLATAGLVLDFVPIVMALRDVTVAHLRIILIHRGRSVGAKWSGKIKAQAQTAGSLLAMLGAIYSQSLGTWMIPVISWVVVVVTVGSIVEYARAAFLSARARR